MEAIQNTLSVLREIYDHVAILYGNIKSLHKYLLWAVLCAFLASWLLSRSRHYLIRNHNRMVASLNTHPFEHLPPFTIYAGFGRRLTAFVLDCIVLLYMLILFPLLSLTSLFLDAPHAVLMSEVSALGAYVGAGMFLGLYLVFWYWKQATPGMALIKTYIADAKTSEKPSVLQLLFRCVGLLISALPFGLGFLWSAWDSKHQGWHDKLAGTVVLQRIVYPN